MRPVALITVILAVAAPCIGEQPTLSFQGTQVVANGLSPGGRVVWRGVSRERVEWITRVHRFADGAATADASGTSAFDLGRAVPMQSIWVVVDVATGGFAAAAPPDYPRPIQSSVVTGLLEKGESGNVEWLREERRRVVGLLVRGGVGVWEASAWAEAVPEHPFALRTLVNFAAMRALGGTAPAPSHLLATDTLVVIDPEVMEYYALLGEAR